MPLTDYGRVAEDTGLLPVLKEPEVGVVEEGEAEAPRASGANMNRAGGAALKGPDVALL